MVNMLGTNTAHPTWGLLDDPHLILFADYFLSHNVKLLSVFVHIVEEREPEIRDKVSECITFLSFKCCFCGIENSDGRCVS